MHSQQQGQGTPQKTFLMLQAGSLNIKIPSIQAIFLMGNSKAGKTTSSHILMNHYLIGKQAQARTFYDTVEDKVPVQYKDARIGQEKSISETQIPNEFQRKIGNEKVYLVDCPGFLDSYGCYRSLSNFYFLNILFNKVQKVNFIIVFKFSNLSGQANDVKNAFTSFFNLFNNIQQVIDRLVPSIAILITETPRKLDKIKIQQQFNKTKLKFSRKIYQQAYEKIKTRIINQSSTRLFQIKEAEVGKTNESQNKLLQKIIQGYKKQFFAIDQSKNPTKISIGDYIAGNQDQFNEQLDEIAKYYKSTLCQNLSSFKSVIQQFIQQCRQIGYQITKQSENKCKFLKEIVQYLDKKQKKIIQYKKDKQYANVMDKFKTKIQTQKNQIFNPKQYKNMFVKSGYPDRAQGKIQSKTFKIKCLKQITQYGEKVNIFSQAQRDLKAIMGYNTLLKEFLQILISYTKRNYPNKQKQVIQFAYIIFKETFLMSQIFKIFTNTANQGKIDINTSHMMIILVQFPKDLKNAFNFQFFKNNKNYHKMLQFPQQIDSNQGKNLDYQKAQYDLKIIQQIRLFFMSKDLNWKKDNQFSDAILQSALKIIQKKQISLNIKIAQNKIYNNIIDKNEDPVVSLNKRRKKIISNMQNKVGYLLPQQIKGINGKILQTMAYYFKQRYQKTIAMGIYKHLHDSYQLLKIYQEEEKQKDSKYALLTQKCQRLQQQILLHLQQYIKAARQHLRPQLAFQKTQKALSFAQKLGKDEQPYRKFMKQIKMNDKIDSQQYYKQTPTFQLPAWLQQQIQNYLNQRIKISPNKSTQSMSSGKGYKKY